MDKIIKFRIDYYFKFKSSSDQVARIYQRYFVHAASEEEAKDKIKAHAKAMHSAHIGPDPKFLVIDKVVEA